MRAASLAAIVLLASLANTCGGPTDDPVTYYSEVGEGEGALHLIAWYGYTEDGTTGEFEHLDWVTPFEDATGCDVQVTYAASSDEMVTLMRQGGGRYDGVSASGDVSNLLIAGGDVAAVDPSLFPEFANVIGPLHPDGGSKTAHYVVDGRVYGTPFMYGPNFLMYDARIVIPPPTSWADTWEADSPYATRVTAYDSPIFIADAALYLMATNPDLGITDPYELDQAQFDAAVELLNQQAGIIGSYWGLYTHEIDGFVERSMAMGTAWSATFAIVATSMRVGAAEPVEGMTGWADTWMISARAPHPNCMLKWMDWTLQPDVQAEVAVYYRAVGSNMNSCSSLAALLVEADGPGSDAAVSTLAYGHCGDADSLDSLYLWKTPQVDCGDDRGEVCVDYAEWTQAWRNMRGVGVPARMSGDSTSAPPPIQCGFDALAVFADDEWTCLHHGVNYHWKPWSWGGTPQECHDKGNAHCQLHHPATSCAPVWAEPPHGADPGYCKWNCLDCTPE